METNLRPSNSLLEYNGALYQFKAYLKSHAFSYRCKRHNTHQCTFLLTIPINHENFGTCILGHVLQHMELSKLPPMDIQGLVLLRIRKNNKKWK